MFQQNFKIKKTKIPATLRNSVWNYYIGHDNKKSICYCCNTENISTGNFECGHVISEKNKGLININNLRPICSLCNKSMGIENMELFMSKCGYSKNIYWNGFKKINNNEIIKTIYNETFKPIELLKNNFNYKIMLEFTDFDMCLYIKLLAEHRFFYIKDVEIYKLYCFNGKQWVNDDTLFKNFISTELYDFLKLLVVELYFDSQNFNKMTTQIKKLKTTKFKKEMVETYKEINVKNDVKLDDKWYLLGFNNLVYDLELGKFREYEFNDYISLTTGYDWRDPLDDELLLMNKLINQIMPIEDERELYLQILASCMSGQCIEHFFVFNGSGGNGKGMINDLLLIALGNYAMIGNNSILFEANKTGSNPEKSNIHKKRLVIFREPAENKKFENSVIKELTGGGTFSARGHHETNTTKELNLTMIVEANKKPLFAEEPTDADVRRIVDIYFRAKYTQNEELVDEKNNIYLANLYYKTNEFKNKYKFALLKILINAFEKYKQNNFKFKIPKSIQERTTQYLEMSCNILQWFKDSYIYTETKTDLCKIKDLYEDFTTSTYFINLTKNEKKKYNKSYFNNYVSTNIFFTKFHKEKYNDVRNCIVGWRKNKDEDEHILDI
jgi:phage/plasmid-associated DNA primase